VVSEAAPGEDSGAASGRRKSLVVFAVHAVLLYLVLAHVPGTKSSYPALFHAEANTVFGLFAGDTAVRLGPPVDTADGSDTLMRGLQRGRLEPRWTARFVIHERGYWALAAVVAMVLATPLPPRRRLVAAATAALLVNLFTLAQVGALAYVSFQAVAATAQSASAARTVAAMQGTFNSEMPRVAAVLFVSAMVARPARTLEPGVAGRFLPGGAPRG
jgi:hypothetical protein